MNVADKVQDLQARLSRAAKQSLDRRFGALYDKMYRRDVLMEAWRRVRANKGAPGIDEQDIESIEQEIGVRTFLKEIRRRLKERRYRAMPVKRCWIEKPGKPDKRPLGIPIIRDRVIQMACKLVIEPIFEANFLECSYGFRPGRSAQMAIQKIVQVVSFAKQRVILDADIKGFFDNVNHRILMNLVRRRISDPRVLRLIEGWLKAGVMEEGRLHETNGVGTPQGGVISPLLANIYLHSFDQMFQQSGLPGTMVRYADDLVIMVWRNGYLVRKQVEKMLRRLKLTLHADKTRVVNAKDGFDFLGEHFRLTRIKAPKTRHRQHCRVWPSERSMGRIREKVRQTIGRRYSMSLEEMIAELNPILRGWDNYQKAADAQRKRIVKLNGFVRDRLRIFWKRKHNAETRGLGRLAGATIAKLGLYPFAYAKA
jgi:group II intron reverse transcriptase/maturase